MWVKLDNENYYADCYIEGDNPEISPFREGVNAVCMTLPLTMVLECLEQF